VGVFPPRRAWRLFPLQGRSAHSLFLLFSKSSTARDYLLCRPPCLLSLPLLIGINTTDASPLLAPFPPLFPPFGRSKVPPLWSGPFFAPWEFLFFPHVGTPGFSFFSLPPDRGFLPKSLLKPLGALLFFLLLKFSNPENLFPPCPSSFLFLI